MDRPEQAARSDGAFSIRGFAAPFPPAKAKAKAAVGWRMGANGGGTVACSADALPSPT